MKLDALKAETKYTESCQIVKFAASNTIHAGVLRISDIRRTQMVSQVNLYCNNKPVNDVGELKNKWELWKRVKTLQVPPAHAEIRFDFTIPVVATNLSTVRARPRRHPHPHPHPHPHLHPHPRPHPPSPSPSPPPSPPTTLTLPTPRPVRSPRGLRVAGEVGARVARTVTDKHGICKHCGDNAYQCRHCRNIN